MHLEKEEGLNKKNFIFVLGLFLFSLLLNAQTWTSSKRITWTPNPTSDAQIAVDSSDIVHVVYVDGPPGDSEIYYKRSTDGGTTWAGTTRLTWNTSYSVNPSMAIDSVDTIHIVWSDLSLATHNELCHKKSTDGGTTWSSTKRLTWSAGISRYPEIVIDTNDHIHLVWEESVSWNFEMFYKKSTNGGNTWIGTKRLSWTPDLSRDPVIAVDSNDNIHVLWWEDTSLKDNLFYRKSTDGGANWVPTKKLTWNDHSSRPFVAIDHSDHIHVVWENYISNREIFHSKSADGGNTWGEAKRLTWNSGISESPLLIVDSSNRLHLIWSDLTPGNYELYHRKSTDGGTIWAGTKRILWTSGNSEYPTAAVDSGDDIHVVWTEISSTYKDILYKKGIQ
jgi:hypothetical protein